MAGGVEENRRLLSALELPDCEGPKLGAFSHRKSTITWLEWISHGDGDAISGGQSYVFKVKIRTRLYVLKVFKFFKPSLYRTYLAPPDSETVTDDELGFHTDPFYAECRAYAQIEARRKKQGIKRKDIADCYGFMALTKADENFLAEYGIDLWCDLPPDDEYRRKAEGSPARALVKEYIEEDMDMDEKYLKRMRTTIKWMNRNKVLVNDISPRNFKNGYLLDFGFAWTWPHCLWRNTSRVNMPTILLVDIVLSEEMVEDMGRGPRHLTRSQSCWMSDDGENSSST
ncbi:kinetochore Sim4 complex subunit FTA2-domain-containing protein [Astrocystis sublimbata]|nr:kinetochore Sim4 complex subunit FTA2-domain-containing protein [Astrocystis sublimbata]